MSVYIVRDDHTGKYWRYAYGGAAVLVAAVADARQFSELLPVREWLEKNPEFAVDATILAYPSMSVISVPPPKAPR